MAERRSVYREKRSLEAVKVSLAEIGQGYIPVQLVDLSARGAAVALPLARSDSLPLSVGTSAHLRFDINGLEPIADVLVHVRQANDVGADRVFGLEIAAWRRIHNRLPAKLFALFNRRRFHRVDVPRLPPIEVDVSHASDQCVTAQLANISGGGCALLFGIEHAPEVGATIRLRFRLPDSADAYDLSGSVKSFFDFKGSEHCGIQFENTESREFIAQQQRICRYVMLRDSELQAQAGTAELRKIGLSGA